MKLDLSTFIGWVAGIAIIVISLALAKDSATNSMKLDFKQVMNFVDVSSMAIVIGGTTCSLLVSYPFSFFARIKKHLSILLKPKKQDPLTYIDQLISYAKEARMNGLLAIEDKLNDCEDIFMKNSLMLVVDSVEPDKVRALLETELDYFDARHSADMEFYLKGSDYAPAFGMIGTLIGLINLLGNLSDTAALVQNMAVALITTFYGSIMSNFIFKPIASKLKIRHDDEFLCKIIVVEGVHAIQDGDNPNFIEEKLLKILAAKVAVQRAAAKS